MRLEHVPAAGRAVRQAQDRVDVQARLASDQGDITGQRHDLGLFFHWDHLVLLGHVVEDGATTPQQRVAERPDRAEGATVQSLLLDERLQPAHHFLALAEGQNVGLCAPLIADDGVSRQLASVRP